MIDTSLKRIIADAGFELNDITRDAVVAERERCAKIAEEYGKEHETYCDNFCGDDLSKLIRKEPNGIR